MGSGCLPLKVGGKGSLLYFGCRQLRVGERGQMPVKRSTLYATPEIRGQELLQASGWGGGAMSRNSTVNSDSHLEVVLRWPDQHYPDCFKYSYSSVLGSICSHILEVQSRNCGSLCQSYSLVIVQLTSTG